MKLWALIISYSIDATEQPTEEPWRARLINHANKKKEVNANGKVLLVNGVPHVAIFAIKDIDVGQEIMYHYGISKLPWKNRLVYS